MYWRRESSELFATVTLSYSITFFLSFLRQQSQLFHSPFCWLSNYQESTPLSHSIPSPNPVRPSAVALPGIADGIAEVFSVPFSINPTRPMDFPTGLASLADLPPEEQVYWSDFVDPFLLPPLCKRPLRNVKALIRWRCPISEAFTILFGNCRTLSNGKCTGIFKK